MYYFYRLMKFPPELFQNKVLILGQVLVKAHLFRELGANCTLIEMNPDAHKIQKEVFAKYATKSSNQFINTSIYEYEAQEPLISFIHEVYLRIQMILNWHKKLLAT